MKNLAIIPARGGSKRIPRKNIKDFLGKPIITYSIEAALKSKLFEKVMVSTEDNEIADIAKKHGAEIPFLRSKQTADDFSTLADVVIEVINKFKDQNISYSNICCLLPTAPFVDADLLRLGYQKFCQKGCDSVVTSCKHPAPIFRAKKIRSGYLEHVFPKYYETRSQDLPETYYDAGQYYWVKSEIVLKEKKLSGGRSIPLILDRKRVQDIDNKEEWKMAVMKFKMLMNS